VVSPLSRAYVTPQPAWVVLAPFIIDPLVAGIACLAAGLFVKSEGPDAARLTATAVISAIAGVTTFPLVRLTTGAGIAALSLLLCVLSIASIRSPRLERHTRILSPVTASILLIGPLWMLRDVLSEYSHRERAIIAGIAVAAVCGVLIALRRWEPHPKLGRTCAVAAAVAVIAILLDSSTSFRAEPAGHASQRLPNVVLISMDTVRADHTSVYGYTRNTTPALAGFARGATTFRNAIASSNYTLPSHTSMFTGLYAGVHGNYEPDTGETLSPRDTTIAEALSRRGYATLSVVSNAPFLGRGFGLDRGFEYLDARYEDDVRYSPRDALLQIALGMPIVQRRRADEIEAESSSLIRRAARQKRPFFLFVNFMDAHAPYAVPREWATLFPGRRRGIDTERLIADLMAAMLHGQRLDLSRAMRDHLVSQYDGAIAFVDRHVGALIDTMRQSGTYEDTLVIITSDHGEAFGDKGFIGHGYSLYQDAIRIPLLIKFPHQTTAAVRDEPVALTDLFATMLETTATAAPHAHFGRPLREPLPLSRTVFSEGFTTLRDRNGVLRAAVTNRYKVIAEPQGDHLFDLRADPNEEKDLADRSRSLPGELLEGIAGLAALQPHNRPGKQIDPETARRLRALGYLQ
jgi:arylsulfatase A-like enzyme